MKVNIDVTKQVIDVGDLMVVGDVTAEGWQQELLVASDEEVYGESVRCVNLENSHCSRSFKTLSEMQEYFSTDGYVILEDIKSDQLVLTRVN